MKTLLMASFVTISAILFAACQKQTTQSNTESVAEIQAVLDRQVAAWNRGDLEGFMNGYWNSPDLTFYSASSAVSGWKTTLDRYRMRYQSEGQEMGQLDFSDEKIEMLGPAAAFVRGRWHLKMSSSEQGGLYTLTFRKLEGGWKIVHDHTS